MKINIQLLKPFIITLIAALCLLPSINYAFSGPAIRFSSVPSIPESLYVGQTYTGYSYTLTGVNNLPIQALLNVVLANHSSDLSITDNTCHVAPTVGNTCTFHLSITPTSAGTLRDSIQALLNVRGNFDPAPSPINVTTVLPKVYVNNYAGGVGETLSVCTMAASGASEGSLTDCAATAGAGMNNPVAIALNPTHTYAYFTQDVMGTNTTIKKCPMNGDNIDTCVSMTDAINFSDPYAIAFNAAGTEAYVANRTGDTISKCTVDDSGVFACSDSGATGIVGPEGLVLNAQGSIAYVANTGANQILRCTVDSNTHNLTTCPNAVTAPLSTTLLQPKGITLSADGKYLYVADYGNARVVQFSVDTDGSLNYVTEKTFSLPANPFAIALFAVDSTHTYAYVTDQGYGVDGATFVCPVNTSTGVLGDCNPVTTTFATPAGIAI